MFKKTNKNIKSFQKSFQGFRDQLAAKSNEELAAKDRNFKIAIGTTQEVCDDLKDMLDTNGDHLQALKLQYAIDKTVASGSDLYRQGFLDCIEYLNHAIQNGQKITEL